MSTILKFIIRNKSSHECEICIESDYKKPKKLIKEMFKQIKKGHLALDLPTDTNHKLLSKD